MSRHNSPLRYPGGKQKIAPFVYEILEENDLLGGHYVEPYAGGAGVAIDLLVKGKVSHIHLNDSCPAVYAFWHSILKYPQEFCRRVLTASMTIEEWQKQRDIINNPKGVERFDLGFAMFFLNRCNRSGILRAGVIGGMKQDGRWKMDARFNRNELIRRIELISDYKTKIKIRNWDAEKFIKQYIPRLPDDTLIYCDPPYFNKADKLYNNHYAPEDHQRIAGVIQEEIKHPWIVSYDNTNEILFNYSDRRKFTYALRYNAAKAYQGSEIFIFSDDLEIPITSEIPSIDHALEEYHYSA